MFDNYKEDLKIAQLIISNHYVDNDYRNYNSTSTIYRCTNEIINCSEYINILKDKKRILSVIASGDQIINSILLGSRDIVGYDISIFPKYFLYLKLAGIKKLDKFEYLDYFVGNYYSKLMNTDVYDKIREELPSKCRIFWDGLYNSFEPFDLNESYLLCNEPFSKDILIYRNLYLQDDNYKKTRLKLDKINLTIYDDNIFKLVNNNIGKFDLINLSSIIHYPKDNFGSIDFGLRKYREFLEELPLNENGEALSYLYRIDSFWKSNGIIDKYYNGDNFRLIPIQCDNFEDGLLVYKK